MNESRRRDFLKVAGGVAVVGSLAGCAGEAQEDGEPGNESEQEDPGMGQEEEPPADEQEEPQEEPQEEEPQEGTGDDMIRVAHMIPDFPAVDVYVDNSEEPVFDDLEYTETTGYVDLPAGDHQIRVTAADAQSLVVFDQQVSIPAGNTTATALAPADSEEATGGAGSSIQLELFSDENTPPEESINDARLRLVHASPDAPAVNVLVGQTTVFENLGYGEAEYFDLPAGDYEFDIVPADGEMMNGSETGTGNESEPGTGNESEGGLFSDLTAADGGSEVTLLQEDGNETEEPLPEEGEEQEDAEDVGPEPVYTFDASLESNSVYTAFATGYLDPEAANSEAEFDVVFAQDVTDGEVVEAEDDE